jgi:hypothetical protein
MILRIPVTLPLLILLSVFFTSCDSKNEQDDIPTDSETIAKGKLVFSQDCHNFRLDGIGPQQGGITHSVSADWIKTFIKDPKQMIASGDERAQNRMAGSGDWRKRAQRAPIFSVDLHQRSKKRARRTPSFFYFSDQSFPGLSFSCHSET